METITLGGDNKTKTTTGTYLLEGDRKWYFDIITREEITTQTQTTDHYLENGCIIQDHAIDKPLYYTLTGFVGEKVHIYSGEPSANEYVQRAKMQDALRKFQTFSQLTPTLSSYVYSAINTGRFVAGKITTFIKMGQGLLAGTKLAEKLNISDKFATDKIRDTFNLLPEKVVGTYGSSKYELDKIAGEKSDIVNRFITKRQKLAYLNFERLRRQHMLLTLYTPWGEVPNVIIEEIRFSQDKYWSMSNASIVVKQLNFIDKKEAKGTENPFDPATQRGKRVENGNIKTKLDTTPSIMKDSGGYYHINSSGMRVDIK